MTTSAIRRIGLTMALAATVLAQLAGTALADTTTVTVNHVASGPVRLPDFGDNVTMSTWTWTTTTLCGTNVGDNYGLLRLQPLQPGASAEFIEIRPGVTSCVERWWSGADVNAMNVSSSALTVATY